MSRCLERSRRFQRQANNSLRDMWRSLQRIRNELEHPPVQARHQQPALYIERLAYDGLGVACGDEPLRPLRSCIGDQDQRESCDGGLRGRLIISSDGQGQVL